jgi:serine protease
VREGKGKDADIAAAIRWAAGIDVPGAPRNPYPARIINLSFGGPGGNPDTLSRAIKDAQNRGAIVVVAAGNQGQNAKDIYPAAIANVITVGAIKFDGKRAPYSNFGNKISLMAPGGDMTEKLPYQFTDPDEKNATAKNYPAGVIGTLYSHKLREFTYHFYEGTSQAAPIVAGVISLLLAINPELNRSDILRIFERSAFSNTKCNEGCGVGLINAERAMRQVTNIPDRNSNGLHYNSPIGGINSTIFGTSCAMAPATDGRSSPSLLPLALLLFWGVWRLKRNIFVASPGTARSRLKTWS